jgi:hypothetical protein
VNFRQHTPAAEDQKLSVLHDVALPERCARKYAGLARVSLAAYDSKALRYQSTWFKVGIAGKFWL